MKKSFRFLSVLVALGLLIAACGAPATPTAEVPAEGESTDAPAEPTKAPAEEPAGESVLNIRMTDEPTIADPCTWIGGEEPIMLSVYEGLVSYKPGTWEVVNTLAESITSSEDGLTIDFKLKEGVQFHHGYGEVTAEDVKFSFERIVDPANQCPYSGDWIALDHVEVTGPYTGQIIMKEPFAALWTTTLPQSSGFILSKAAVEEAGEAYGTSVVVGTGPYELVEWPVNEPRIVRKFADYSGNNSEYAEPSEWDTIRFLPIAEDSAAAIGIETGEIDFGRVGNVDIDRLDALVNVDVATRDTIDYTWIGMNVQHEILSDINVRQAIRYGIDVPAILEAVYENRWSRTCAMIAPGQVGHWADAPCYERDVELARQYLADAGYADGVDLIFRTDESETAHAIAEITQANLAEVGINITIENLDDSAMTEAHFGPEALATNQLFVANFITNPDPSWSTVWFLCEQVEVWNWMEWCSEEYDELHFAALREFDPDARADMYIQMMQLWDEAVHSVWLANPTYYFAHQTDIVPSLMPHGRILAWDFRSQ